MAEILKLSTQEIKITMITILRVLMEKEDTTQEEIGNVITWMEILIKIQRKY